MATIFISHAREDAECAGVIRQGLEEKGYGVWRAPDYPTPTDASYAYVVENGIMGSAAVLLVWSEAAARFEWGRRHLAFAQRLGKPIVPVALVALNETPLPGTLLVEPVVVEKGACGEVVTQALLRLPEANSDDPFLKMSELAAHEYIRHRKEAIDLAAGFVQRREHGAEALAILDYLAHNDLMNGVREKAQEVLDAHSSTTRANAPIPGASAQAPTSTRLPDAGNGASENRYKFRARCKNGHVSAFDKADACSQRSKVAREIPRGFRVVLDELVLKCPVCQVEMAVDIDCEGY